MTASKFDRITGNFSNIDRAVRSVNCHMTLHMHKGVLNIVGGVLPKWYLF